MSDVSQGPGWWQASDLKWYPPEQHLDNSPPEPGWWLASDFKWYPPELGPGPLPKAPQPSSSPRSNSIAPPRSSRRPLSTPRGKAVFAVCVVLLAGLVSGLVAGLTGGGASRSKPLPAVAGSSATSASQSTTSTAPMTTTPVVTAPAVTTPPATTPQVTTPPVTTVPVTTPPNSVVPTTTIACPSGSVDTSVSMQRQESTTGDMWTLKATATLTNNTSGTIIPSYVSVEVLGANGEELEELTLGPSGPTSVDPGQSVTLSGSGTVSSTSQPSTGPVTAHWSWADPQDSGCNY